MVTNIYKQALHSHYPYKFLPDIWVLKSLDPTAKLKKGAKESDFVCSIQLPPDQHIFRFSPLKNRNIFLNCLNSYEIVT